MENVTNSVKPDWIDCPGEPYSKNSSNPIIKRNCLTDTTEVGSSPKGVVR